MKLVLTAALCLVPALAFAGEKPTSEEPTVTATAAVDQEVVEEVESGCSDGDCNLRTRRVWPLRVVEVFDCKDGCCNSRMRVVTPRCRTTCCEEEACCESACECEDSCDDATRCRPRLRLFRRWRTTKTSCCN